MSKEKKKKVKRKISKTHFYHGKKELLIKAVALLELSFPRSYHPAELHSGMERYEENYEGGHSKRTNLSRNYQS